MSNRMISKASALAAMLCVTVVGAGAQTIQVRVNDEPVRFEGTRPQEVRGRVMVPLRGVLETLGAYVEWDPANRIVTANRGDTNIELPVGSSTARVNGKTVWLDVPAMVVGGSTMVPLRFVSESLGANVRWDAGTDTVLIQTGDRAARNDVNTMDNGINRRAIDTSTPGRAHRSTVNRVTLPVGTVIPVKMDDTLSSKNSRPGDKFTATVRTGRDDAGLPEGTRIEGVVREALPAEGDKPGVLDLDFQRMVLPDGQSRSIDASLISLDNKDLRHDSSGRLVASTSNSKSKDRLKFIGIGAGAGLLIGALTKGNTLTDVLLGAGAGYLFNELKKDKPSDVNLASGTEFGVRLDSQLAYNGDMGSNDRSYNQNNDRYYRNR